MSTTAGLTSAATWEVVSDFPLEGDVARAPDGPWFGRNAYADPGAGGAAEQDEAYGCENEYLAAPARSLRS